MKIAKNPVREPKENQILKTDKIWNLTIYYLARIGDGVIFIFQAMALALNITSSKINILLNKSNIKLQQFLTRKKVSRVKPKFQAKLIAKARSAFFTEILAKLKKHNRNLTRKTGKFIKDQHVLFKYYRLHLLTRILPLDLTEKLRFKLPNVTVPKIRFQLPRPPRLLIGITLGIAISSLFIFIPYNIYLFLKLLPNPRALSMRVIPITTQISDRNGDLLYEIYSQENRKPIQFADIPDIVKQATIAIEDKQFYYHPGFSLIGIARATRETLFKKQLQGGSTITQQLIKNALLTPEVTFKRKFLEILLAFWAERIYTKNEILEMYFNQVPYGGTAWGIETAAETYFGKKVQELDLSEAAYLAGLPAAPTFYSPYGLKPDLAKVRQEEVLRRMFDDGYINQAQLDAAKSAPLKIKSKINNIKAPHFVMYVRQLLTQIYGNRVVDQGGLRITTSLDLSLQEKVQEIVTTQIADLQRLRVGNGAAMVTNPKTGEILAMVGSKDYFNEAENGNVNVTLSPRQPGSAIKPLTYAAAIEKGLTAASFIEDSPVAYVTRGQPTYAPVNYDSRFHGVVTVRSALANSYNIPAVKTLNRIGVKSLLDMGKRMGITTWNDESRFGLALTLGGGEVTLYDLITAYGVIANSGSRVDLNPILKIADYTGRIYYERPSASDHSVISAETAYILSSILSDNQARTPAFGPSSALVIPGKTVAVKTGTTNDKRDNWTIGYTPNIAAGVWVGNNDNKPMNQYLTSGITGAAPIWNQIMQYLLKDKTDEQFPLPAKIVKIPCYSRYEYFTSGTEPKGGCAPIPSPLIIPSPNPN